MLVGKSWKIETDSTNVILLRKSVRTNKSTGEKYDNWSIFGYFASVKHALHALVEQGVRDANLVDLRVLDAKLDVLHQDIECLSGGLAGVPGPSQPETIVLEDLNVAGMLQNRHLSKAIADASFAELRRQLEYKCAWYGVNLVVADRFYPSSKTCSSCGAKKPLLKLSERTFVCASCGAVIDRDFNASLNLAKLGSSSLDLEPPNKRGLPVEGACGYLNTRTDPMKQELGSNTHKSEVTPPVLEFCSTRTNLDRRFG